MLSIFPKTSTAASKVPTQLSLAPKHFLLPLTQLRGSFRRF